MIDRPRRRRFGPGGSAGAGRARPVRGLVRAVAGRPGSPAHRAWRAVAGRRALAVGRYGVRRIGPAGPGLPALAAARPGLPAAPAALRRAAAALGRQAIVRRPEGRVHRRGGAGDARRRRRRVRPRLAVGQAQHGPAARQPHRRVLGHAHRARRPPARAPRRARARPAASASASLREHVADIGPGQRRRGGRLECDRVSGGDDAQPQLQGDQRPRLRRVPERAHRRRSRRPSPSPPSHPATGPPPTRGSP